MQVTTTNQETGEVDKTAEPLRTLSSFRTGKLLNWDADPTFRNLSFFGEIHSFIESRADVPDLCF